MIAAAPAVGPAAIRSSWWARLISTGLTLRGEMIARESIDDLARATIGRPLAFHLRDGIPAHPPTDDIIGRDSPDPADVIGRVDRVVIGAGGLYGVVEIFEAGRGAEVDAVLGCQWRAGVVEQFLGLSPLARVREERGITRFIHVISVDVVAQPLAGGRFLRPAHQEARS